MKKKKYVPGLWFIRTVKHQLYLGLIIFGIRGIRFKIRWYERTACWLPSSWLMLPNQTWQALYRSTLKLGSPLKLVITMLPQWHSRDVRHWWHRCEIAYKMTNSIPFSLHTLPLEVFTSDSPMERQHLVTLNFSVWWRTPEHSIKHFSGTSSITVRLQSKHTGGRYGLSRDGNPSPRLGGISEKGQSWLACFDLFSLQMLTSVDQLS